MINGQLLWSSYSSIASRAILVSCVCFLIGCSSDNNPSDGDDQPDRRTEMPATAETKLEVQIALGRRGETDRLTLRSQVADQNALATLNDQDLWLETVTLDAGVVDDELAATFALLPNLVHLRLRQSPVGDQTLAKLAGSASLRILNLPQCEATANGVAALKQLKSLRSLRIGGANLGADTASAVASLSQLRSLHLIGVPIDDQGLRQIASMPELASLFVDDSEVSEQGWDWLFDNHQDLHVHVNQKHLDRLSEQELAGRRDQESGTAATRFSKDHAPGEHLP